MLSIFRLREPNPTALAEPPLPPPPDTLAARLRVSILAALDDLTSRRPSPLIVTTLASLARPMIAAANDSSIEQAVDVVIALGKRLEVAKSSGTLAPDALDGLLTPDSGPV